MEIPASVDTKIQVSASVEILVSTHLYLCTLVTNLQDYIGALTTIEYSNDIGPHKQSQEYIIFQSVQNGRPKP